MGLQKLFEKLALVGVEWVVWLLIFLSMVSIAIMAERGVFFWKKRREDIAELMEKLKSLLSRNDISGARRYLESKTSVEAIVTLEGIKEIHRGAGSAEEAMIGTRIREKLSLERYLAVLGTVGNSAPFLGLFGTVTGIIKSFYALAITENPDMKTVMYGISEALVTTALGLIVAIPAVWAFNIFQRQIKGIMTRSETAARLVLAHIKAENKISHQGSNDGELAHVEEDDDKPGADDEKNPRKEKESGDGIKESKGGKGK